MTLALLVICGMFCVPFVLLATIYHGLPPELPVIRSWIRHTARSAPKSVFMVFRVPLMNLIHGLLAIIMLRRAKDFDDMVRRTGYSNFFSTLLFTIALKTNLEAIETALAASALLKHSAAWLGFGTLTTVVAGVSLALIRGRRAPLPWPELRLTTRDRVLIIGLIAVYVALVVTSLAASHRA